jgi:arylsulfatase A-like enzyme
VAAVSLVAALASCGAPEPAPHLLLVTIDTLRADRLGCHGDPAARTPALDRLAREGVQFEQAVCQVPITLPSHATILTGLYPRSHGIRDNGLARLAPGTATLARFLRERGYRTAAFVSAAPLDARFGLDDGFDVYDDRMPPGRGRFAYPERRGDRTAALAVEWLRRNAGEAPVFLWLHLFDPHSPYAPPAPFDEWLGGDRYAGECSFADHCVGRLLRELDALGQADRSLVAAVSDHGEGLGDHGEDSHAVYVHETTIHVPLLVRAPGLPKRGRLVAGPVETVDLVPTFLSMLGLPPGPSLPGRDLAPSILDEDPTGADGVDRTAYAESAYGFLQFGWSPLFTLRQGSWKLVRSAGRDRLHDLERDPGELEDASEERPAVARRLGATLDRRYAAMPESEAPSETIASLRALGYLSGGGAGIEIPPPDALAAGEHPDPAERTETLRLIQAAQTAANRGEAGEAVRILESLGETEAANPSVRFLLAEQIQALGRDAPPDRKAALYERALRLTREALRIRGGDPRTTELAMKLCLLLGHFEECRRIADAILSPTPGYYFLRANLHSLEGSPYVDRDRAIRDLEAALELDPNLDSARSLLDRLRAR